MKENSEESGGDLVPSTNRGLTKSSGLVRRGLDDLVKGQQGIGPSPQRPGLTLTNEAGVSWNNPEWTLIEQVIRELDTGSGNSFCCLEVGDKWVQTLHGFNGYHVEWCPNTVAEDNSFAIWRASSLGGSPSVAELKKHDGYTNPGEHRDLLHLDDVLTAFCALYDGIGMPTSLAWRVLDLEVKALRSGFVRFPTDRSVGELYAYDSNDTKSDSLYGYTQGKYIGEAKGIITLPDNKKELWLSLNEAAAKDFSFFAEMEAHDVQSLSLDFWEVTFDEREMSHLKRLTGLRKLFLGSLAITNNCLANIRELVNLCWLDLSDTRIDDRGLEYLVQLDQLEVLDLEMTSISDAGAPRLLALGSLKELSLESTSIGDGGLKRLCRLTSLLHLNLNQTRITDAGLATCRDLRDLESLDLAYTAVTDAGLAHLKGLAKLKTLVLSGTKITSVGLEYLKEMTALEWLNLTDTQIIDTDLIPLRHLTKLRGLGLNSKQTTPRGISELKRLIPNCAIGDDLVP